MIIQFRYTNCVFDITNVYNYIDKRIINKYIVHII